MTLTGADALKRLGELGASPRLSKHAELVAEVAELLIEKIQAEGIALNADFIRAGAILHDAGKILHPGEFDGPGARHEAAGERLLVANGADPALARCCLSHARWAEMECSLEELIIALADTLWKGKRNARLEQRVIDGAAARTGGDAWNLFIALDTAFEAVADGGPARLARSVKDIS